MSKIDPLEFRNILGSYVTGVAIVTTTDCTGKPTGMTINSFAPVSLDPPLVLWSIARDSDLFDVFNQASHFAIHILRRNQEELSNQFAVPNDDKFAGVAYNSGISDLPILKSYIACFQCSVERHHEGGDHIILIGRVLNADYKPDEPLVFHGGQYKSIS